MSDVRVRFPPSPTGEPHVGNIRTAIFNWLFARRHGGAFVIRVEDTDQARMVDGATEQLLDALRWLGLDWDEGPEVGGPYGPYYQSQRLDIYSREAGRLVRSGHAYRCYCSQERLAVAREERARRKEPPGYDRRCRGLTQVERRDLDASGTTPVVRFKMPLEGVTKVDDLIRGKVTFQNRLADDFVMLKSDGFPTYHLANVTDDHLMKISHVMRGEEWLSSTPRHVRLYAALGWEPPRFAHLPLILASDRSKLSKRHGATSLLECKALGLLPETLFNFLTMLGWSLDDRTEILTVDEMIEGFSIERVSKAGAVFDYDKLSWMNGVYIRRMTPKALADALLDYWRLYPPPEIPDMPDRDRLAAVAAVVQERLKTLADAAPRIPFFFYPDFDYEPEDLVQRKMDEAGTRRALEASLETIEGLESPDAATLEGAMRPLADDLGIKVGQLLGTLRVATTGLRVSPPLFESMEVLGKERIVRDIRRALAKIA